MGIESLDCLKWHLLLREEDQVNVVGEVLQVLTIFSFLLLLHFYKIKVILWHHCKNTLLEPLCFCIFL